MQEVETKEIEQVSIHPLLDLPIARLQIVQFQGEFVRDEPLTRPMIEPTMQMNADGLWVLTVRRQGEHGKFTMPYIGTEIISADAESGLIVVLCAFHGTEAWGRSRNKHVQKGQFYRFYQQQADGAWGQLQWQPMSDEMRQVILDMPKPEWARQPGKLRTERNPMPKQVETVGYKVVRKIGDQFYSLYNPEIEYVIGQRVKQAAKPGHGGGYFSWPNVEAGLVYLKGCARGIPFGDDSPEVALVECEIGGRIIDYGHKRASTYLCLTRVLEVRSVLKG